MQLLNVNAWCAYTGGAFFFRERLAGLELNVPSLPGFLRGRFGRQSNHTGLDYLDPEEDLDLAPEFVGATRPPQGGYQNLPGGD